MKTILLCVLLLLTSASIQLYSNTAVSQRTPINLAQAIPQHIGDWQLIHETSHSATQLERIYRNPQQHIIMLSISWNANTLSETEQSHRPEYCYQAQGYTIQHSTQHLLPTPYGKLPLRQFTAQRQQRVEHISYWLTIGQHPTLPGLERKLRQLQYWLTRQPHDGLIIRLSTPTQQATQHAQFITDMLATVSEGVRGRMI